MPALLWLQEADPLFEWSRELAAIEDADSLRDDLESDGPLSIPHDTGPAYVASQTHYRRAADSFAQDAYGIIQGWNGIDLPWRFESAVGSYETVGVIPPLTPVSMGITGSGNIVGQFYAYCRFIDRDGNYSSLSPISDPCYCQTHIGTISGASFSSPIVVTGLNGFADGQIIKIDGVLGNTAANGIWNVKNVDSGLALYTEQTLTTASVGSGVYVSGGDVYTGVAAINYSNVPVSTEDRVVRRQILRNQDGDTSVFYIDIDTDNLTSTDFWSATLSAQLVDGVALKDDNGLTLVDKSRPVSIKKCVAFAQGRMFACGNETYSEGAVVLTNGSNVVTGIGTEWGQVTFPGRFFEVVGGNKRYTIDTVTSETSLTLTEAYAGSTDPYALYSIIVGDSERRTVYYSEPDEPEAWPLSDSFQVNEDVNNGEVTGLFSFRSFIYITTEHRLWKYSFLNEPLIDGQIFKAANRGLVNNRCAAQTDEGVFLLDDLGIHMFSGNDDQNISSPAVQDMFRAEPLGPYKINWRASRNFHAIYSPSEATIRWFVSMGESYAPRYAICFNTRFGRWWLEQYPWPVGASCLGRINGHPQVFIGTTGRRIFALGLGTLDGPVSADGTTRGTVTSAGIDWIADSAASFASSNLVGNSVAIVRGRGKGQSRTVIAVSSGRISVNLPWTIRPDTTSVYQLGGIEWRWLSGWHRWMESDYQGVRGIAVQWKATDDPQELFLRVYKDLSDDPEDWTRDSTFKSSNGICHLANDPDTDLAIDSQRTRGYVLMNLSEFKDWYTDASRFAAVELNGVTNSEPMIVYRVSVYGAQGGRQ